MKPELDSSEVINQEDEFKKIVDWVIQNESNFMKVILQKLLEQFNYDDKLTGDYANKFLNENQLYELIVGKIDNQQLLIFEELFEE